MKLAGSLIVVLFGLIVGCAILFPSPLIIKGFLILAIGIIFALQRQETFIYTAIFLAFFSIYLKYLATTSNAVIIGLIVLLFIKAVIEGRSVISKRAIYQNPAFVPLVLIFSVYFYSFLSVVFQGGPGYEYHYAMFLTIACVISLFFILVGFITNRARLFAVLKVLALLLVINLIYALVTLLNPAVGMYGRTLGFSTSGTVVAGQGLDEASRLGGLTFFWEAYAEFLMMTVIFLASILVNLDLLVKRRALLTVIFFISLAELFLTNTRGSVVLAACGILFVVIFVGQKSLKRRVPVIIALAITGVLLFSVLSITGQVRLKERFSDFSQWKQTQYGNLPQGRVDVWLPTLDYVTRRHFVGAGPSFYPLTAYPGGSGILSWPHNLVLIILATVGIPGIVCYMFLFVKFLLLQNRFHVLTDNNLRVVYGSLWAALLFFCIEQLKFDELLRAPTSYAYFIWVLFAIMFSVCNMQEINRDSK